MAPARLTSASRLAGRAAARLREAVGLVVLGAALVGIVAPAAAQTLDASYRVQDVEVEATAEDAVAAQARAIEVGQRRALERLLRRLTGGDEVLPEVAQVSVEELVSSFEVLDETIGPTSYAATLEVAFDREAVQELLEERGVGYADAAASPAVLVPLWQTGEGLRLWGSDNAWKVAWDRALEPDALAPFVVPLGDLQDLAILNPDQAARGDEGALAELAERYGTDGAVVAVLRGSGAPGEALEITARHHGDETGEPYRATVRRGPDEPLAQSLERAVDEMQSAFDTRFSARRVARDGPSASLVVVTEVPGLDGWGNLMRLLEDLAEVEDAEVRHFSRGEATLELRVAGGVDGLRDSLGRAGWLLEPRDDDRWRLERGGAADDTSTL